MSEKLLFINADTKKPGRQPQEQRIPPPTKPIQKQYPPLKPHRQPEISPPKPRKGK